ncbi:cytochrome c-type biogenesis protein [Ideonella sp. YS5]|uniref:cytochrome c-type biogenesis protein n=1 Tax=Ideonella sp. YS5 TaxID=3453714 RepID=UPI003EEC4D6E
MAAAFVLLAASPAWAATAPEDDALSRQVASLAGELRCLVCQNQSLADSHAQLALDLKQQVRDQLAAGASRQQVIDYMVERYGDFVLYNPPLKPSTWLLWFGPLLMLGFGLALLWPGRRRRRGARRVP